MTDDPNRRLYLQSALMFTGFVVAGLALGVVMALVYADRGGVIHLLLAVGGLVVGLMATRVAYRCWTRYRIGPSYQPGAD